MCCYLFLICIICLIVIRKTVVVGAGYIAVELAGILHTLGSDVSLLIRYDHVSCVDGVLGHC